MIWKRKGKLNRTMQAQLSAWSSWWRKEDPDWSNWGCFARALYMYLLYRDGCNGSGLGLGVTPRVQSSFLVVNEWGRCTVAFSSRLLFGLLCNASWGQNQQHYKTKEEREATKLIYSIVGCLISFPVLQSKKCQGSNQDYCESNLSKVISCFLWHIWKLFVVEKIIFCC